MRVFTIAEFSSLQIIYNSAHMLYDTPFITEGLAKQRDVDLKVGDTVYYIIKTTTTEGSFLSVEKAIIIGDDDVH